MTFLNNSAGRQTDRQAIEQRWEGLATLLNHQRQKYFNAVDLEKGQNLDYIA